MFSIEILPLVRLLIDFKQDIPMCFIWSVFCSLLWDVYFCKYWPYNNPCCAEFIWGNYVNLFYHPPWNGASSWDLFSPWWRDQTELFPFYRPFVKGIHRSLLDSPHKGRWHGSLMFFFICARKRLIRQARCRWCETLIRRSLGRHGNGGRQTTQWVRCDHK